MSLETEKFSQNIMNNNAVREVGFNRNITHDKQQQMKHFCLILYTALICNSIIQLFCFPSASFLTGFNRFYKSRPNNTYLLQEISSLC